MTKTGDGGQTRIGGKVVPKNDSLIETLGEMDELQAVVTLVKIHVNNNQTKDKLDIVIKNLWALMGQLATGSNTVDWQLAGSELEKEIKEIENKIGEIYKFLVFGKEEAVYLNWARTVVRRAERRLVGLSSQNKIDENVIIYINRLSDYLFILTREAEERV